MQIQSLLSRRSVLGSQPVVVSLTTFGIRINTVHITIESIARGSVRPQQMYLWLDDERLLKKLTPGLRRLKRRGLRIEFTEPLGPHAKYFPHVERNNIDLPLVTADDDIIYPGAWLARLMDAHKSDPSTISCMRAHRIILDLEGRPYPYDRWPGVTHTEPRYSTFATGVSGVIYPPEFLSKLKFEGKQFLQITPKNDDVWLHSRAVRYGFRTRQMQTESLHFPVIPGTQRTALNHANVHQAGNDLQIEAAYSDAELMHIAGDNGK
ncbi:hypothetical protein [Salinibacterium sp. ZJ454]|uniref:hypothetical protein n=1 Tax=Salinibacterium sp. ZJ454 TaxID=2708339 RepID=UPI001422E23A|nr:hypothetical protein [Salinibacterium sp. ZJ454]